MKQDRFAELHEPGWGELERLLDALERGRFSPPRRLEPSGGGPPPPADPASLPTRYRAVTQQLALARSRGYSLGLIERLERLTLRGHQLIYERRAPLAQTVAGFVRRDFPRVARREWRSLLVAGLCFFGPMLGAALAVALEPTLLLTVMDPAEIDALEAMYHPDNARRLGRERESAEDFAMFGFYLRNNTGIGFQTFASGLLLGLGTLFFLVFNGVVIGAVSGHLTAGGFATPFWSFVSGHSAFELIAILLSGAAGLRLGWALLSPGRLTRAQALKEAARGGIGLVYGAAALFLAAAFVEAFWSSLVTVPPAAKYAVGVTAWLGMVVYLGWGGRDAG